MIRPTSLILLALSTAAGGALFHVSFAVGELEDRLVRLNRDIRADREAIHVLRAEWSFLNQPARIEELSQRYLEMAPLDGHQISSAAAVPVRLHEIDPDAPGMGDVLASGTDPRPKAKPTPPKPATAAAPTFAPVATAYGTTRVSASTRSLDDVLREITQGRRP